MSCDSSKLTDFLTENIDDLSVLGLLFLRLLAADFNVMSHQPSATLAVVLGLEQEGILYTRRQLTDLISALNGMDLPMLTDGFGGSILRNTV